MPSRNLVLSDDKSDKFWSITLTGSKHTVVYGRTGTAGRKQEKSFGDKASAKKSYDKLIQSKLAKGYTDAPRASKGKKTKKQALTQIKQPETVKECWRLIQDWVSHSDHDGRFGKGATAAQVRSLADYLCRRLPDSLSESLKSVSAAEGVIPNPGYDTMALSLLTIDEIIDGWVMMNELYDTESWDHSQVKSSKGVIQQWWAPYWLPFAHDGGGDYLCIDLCPTFPGKIGQVLWVPHDSSERVKLADSLLEFLQKLAAEYVNGSYETSTDGYGVTKIKGRKGRCFPRA